MVDVETSPRRKVGRYRGPRKRPNVAAALGLWAHAASIAVLWVGAIAKAPRPMRPPWKQVALEVWPFAFGSLLLVWLGRSVLKGKRRTAAVLTVMFFPFVAITLSGWSVPNPRLFANEALVPATIAFALSYYIAIIALAGE